MRPIYKAGVLLGHIIMFHNDLHPADAARRKCEFAELETALTVLELSCTSNPASILSVPEERLNHVVWLVILLQMCTMLLYHPTASPGKQQSEDAKGQDLGDIGLMRCLNAMHNTVMVIKETAGRCIDALCNPFLIPAYFLCCRFLAIGWHERKDPAFRQNVYLMLLLIDRVGLVWCPLASKFKFKFSMVSDLNKDVEQVQAMRVGTGNYFGSECKPSPAKQDL